MINLARDRGRQYKNNWPKIGQRGCNRFQGWNWYLSRVQSTPKYTAFPVLGQDHNSDYTKSVPRDRAKIVVVLDLGIDPQKARNSKEQRCDPVLVQWVVY
jgi:hypothetical protein